MAEPKWEQVEKVAKDAIKSAGAILETHGVDTTKTEYHRGMIAAMRIILSLATPREKIPDTDPLY